MKQYWQKLALKIDALSLRERAIIFAAVAAVLVVLFNTLFLDRQSAKRKQLTQRIMQEQSQIAAMQAEIQQKLAEQEDDPASLMKKRVQQLQLQSSQMRSELDSLGKGFVSPDKMSSLLEDILKQNPKLQLISLKTIPTSSLTESALSQSGLTEENLPEDQAGSVQKDKDAATSSKEADPQLIYRHGVEIVVQGSYLDIMDYLGQLEAMPWRVFWGKAGLVVGEHPKAILTLRLYTLSLDKKWLNI